MTARTANTGYSAASIDLLDRDSQSVKALMLYPITKIQLHETRDNQVVTVRTFIVNEANQWVEIS